MACLAKRLRVVGLAAIAAAACAHAPPTRPVAAEVFWPEPPEAARVRLASVVPDAGAEPAPRSLWRRILEAVVGIDQAERERERRPLERPFGVAIGPAGELFVADPDLRIVARVRAGGGLDVLSCRGREWAAPMALAVAPDGALLVADAGAAEVVRIGRGGRCAAIGAGELERPTGVAERGGRVYVADPPRHAIAVFDASGALAARFGGRGEGDGQLSFPTAVAVAPDGTVLVVDALNFRVARFASDGRWLGAFGAPGEEGSLFARPKGIAAGADGRIYVSDAQRDVVLVFLPDGAFDYAIGATGDAAGRFAHPAGLAIGGARLLVADSHNARLQAFDVLAGGGS